MINNTNYKELCNNEQVEALLKSIDWETSFVKESHFYSPSYVVESGIVAADSEFSLRLAICLPENDSKIIEFQFCNVEEIGLFAQTDIFPKIIFRHNEVTFKLFENSQYSIRCKKIFFKWLENFYSGDCSIYTDQDFYA